MELCPAEGCGTTLVNTTVNKVFGNLGGEDNIFELLIPEEVVISVCPKCQHAIIYPTTPKEQKLVEVPEKKIILPGV